MSALSTAAAKAREWTARRNVEIVRARKAGASLRAIAEEAGLSHTAIRQILKQEGIS